MPQAPGLTYRLRQATRRIILHDSHLPSTHRSHLAAMRATGRTMGLLDIGYHLVIERDGRCFEARPVDCVGSHTPGCNHDSVGVCLAGGFEGADDFTLEQEETLHALLDVLLSRYPEAAVRGHSECVRRRGPTCPSLDMNALRQSITRSHEPMELPKTAPPAEPEATRLTGQQQVIVDYLTNRGDLTNLHALVSLGIGSITSRIAELRAKGYTITSTAAKDFHGKDYVRYSLVGTPAAVVTEATSS